MAELGEDHHVHRLLIVDDHELTHAGFRLVLEPTNFEIVGHLKSAVEVRPFLASESVDIVLLDLGLPDEDGLALLAELVTTMDTSVLVISGSENAHDFSAALRLGARAVVSKSDKSKTLRAALDAVKNGVTFVSEYVQELIAQRPPTEVSLSPRQMAILHFLSRGETNKEIGYRLSISPPTVSFHLREIREKLGVDNNRKITESARRRGLI